MRCNRLVHNSIAVVALATMLCAFAVITVNEPAGATGTPGGAIPLGSPSSGFGNAVTTVDNPAVPTCPQFQPSQTAPCGPQPMLWAAITSPYESFQNGDPYTTKCARSGTSGSRANCDNATAPNGANNPLYRPSGYTYAVDVGPADVGVPLTVWVYDAKQIARTTGNSTSGADCKSLSAPWPTGFPSGFTNQHCQTGDSSGYESTGGNDGYGSGSPLDLQLFDNDGVDGSTPTTTPLACHLMVKTSDPTATYKNKWVTVCTFTPTQTGVYPLQARSSGFGTGAGNSDTPTDRGIGYNAFALQLSGGTATQLYPVDDMSIWMNTPGSSLQSVYLAEIGTEHAGKKMEIDLFDPGDGGGTSEYWLKVLAPPGGAPGVVPSGGTTIPSAGWASSCNFNATGSATKAPATPDVAANCRVRTKTAPGGVYNNSWLRIEVQIDPAYDCSADCWWTIQYDFGAAPLPGDRTVWSVRMQSDPVAVDDVGSTSSASALSVGAPGVLGNDSDPDGDPLAATLVAAPANGALTLNPDGSYLYTPELGYTGPDSFTYTVSDGQGGVSNVATVNLTVTNTVPVAVDDTGVTDIDTVLNVAAPGVIGNDTDADGHTLTAALGTDVTHGDLVFDADGSYTYTPDTAYVGPDSFTYTVDDGHAGTSSAATVNLFTGPTVLPAGTAVPEGDTGVTVMAVPVTLSRPSAVPVTVEWTTVDFQATAADNDYVPATGTVTFDPGQTAKTAPVTINADTTNEPDEQLLVSFTNATNATIGGFYGLSFATIIDDDTVPLVVPGGASVVEGDTGTKTVQIPVRITHPVATPVTVNWTTSDFQATGTDDFAPASGTVTFDPGQTAATVPITVNADTTIEADEYFLVSFTNPTGARIGGFYGLAFGLIIDDDTVPMIVPGGYSITEGNTGTTTIDVPVTLSHPSAVPVTVDWTTIDYDATTPDDYQAADGTITFDPGQTTKTVPITINADTTIEPDEYALISYTNPTNARIGGFYGLSLINIINDD